MKSLVLFTGAFKKGSDQNRWIKDFGNYDYELTNLAKGGFFVVVEEMSGGRFIYQ